MSASTGDEQPPTAPEDSGSAVLVAAMDAAPAAIWFLAGVGEPAVWANARARGMGAGWSDLPVVGGRPATELVEAALRAGRQDALHGPVGGDGPVGTAVVRPLQVGGGYGALLVLETEADQERSPWPVGEVDVVEKVQHSLLPPSLPMLPDLWLSGSYHRASSVRAAGGDWYDAVALGQGRLALVVGDAVGHGVPAAGAMSRLRGAMRSSALLDPEPASVIRALDAFAGQMDDVEGASVFYGVLDAATGRLTYAAAGHPAPLVVGTDGDTRFLPVTPRPPLGSVPDAVTEVAEHLLEQGATLVLVSDGAVVGAGDSPGDGMSRLAEVAAEVLAGAAPLEVEASADLAAAVAEGVRTPQGWPDDVAVLVAHRRAMSLEPVVLDLPAVPSSLPGVRRRLGAWLAGLGMGEQDRVGVMVAVGEACANAVEHAYRGQEPGRMYLDAHVDVDGVLTVQVRDEGSWRPPDRDPGDRGRGLLIMRQMVDRVVLEEGHGTTVTLSIRLRRTPEVDVERAVAEAAATVVVDRTTMPCAVVRVSGAVDTVSAELLRIRLLEASHGGTSRVELDLGGVTLLSSAGVRVVLAIARIARDEQWRLVVHAPEGGVTRHVLEISGLGGQVDLD
ncbi:SpoIIE family protein phosphatase [Geodermatophilus sp. SYSU D00691]